MVPQTDLVKLQGSQIWGVVFAVRSPLHVIAAYLFAISILLIGMRVGCLVSGGNTAAGELALAAKAFIN